MPPSTVVLTYLAGLSWCGVWGGEGYTVCVYQVLLSKPCKSTDRVYLLRTAPGGTVGWGVWYTLYAMSHLHILCCLV